MIIAENNAQTREVWMLRPERSCFPAVNQIWTEFSVNMVLQEFGHMSKAVA